MISPPNARHVAVDVDETELDGDYRTVPGVTVTCSKCGDSVEVYDTSEDSICCGCAMLSEDCTVGKFWYVPEVEAWLMPKKQAPPGLLVARSTCWRKARGGSIKNGRCVGDV